MVRFGERRGAAMVFAAITLLPTRPVAASIEDVAAAPAVRSDPTVEASVSAEAETLYRRGLSAYETFDYAQAIRLWSDAYHMLRDVDGAEESRLSLVYNIATARLKAYAINKDVGQLRQAKLLLESYLEGIGAVRDEKGWSIPEEMLSKARLEDTMRVEATLREIDAALGVAAGAETTASPRAATERASPPARAERRPRAGVGLVAAGAATGAVGLGMLGMMGAGLARGARVQERFDDPSVPASDLTDAASDGRRANAIAIAGGVLAATLIATSVVLTVFGVRRMRAGASSGSSAQLRRALGMRWSGIASLR